MPPPWPNHERTEAVVNSRLGCIGMCRSPPRRSHPKDGRDDSSVNGTMGTTRCFAKLLNEQRQTIRFVAPRLYLELAEFLPHELLNQLPTRQTGSRGKVCLLSANFGVQRSTRGSAPSGVDILPSHRG